MSWDSGLNNSSKAVKACARIFCHSLIGSDHFWHNKTNKPE
jgi:hypothetical protein